MKEPAKSAKSPPKILEVNKLYWPWLGGVETHVKQISEQLIKVGYPLRVLCCNTRFKTEIEDCQGVPVTRVSSFGIFFSMPVSFSFFLLLRKQKADFLHIHLPNPLAVLAYCVMRPRGKLIVTWHSDIIRQRLFKWLFHPILMAFLKKADVIIATSPRLIEHTRYLQRFKEKSISIPLALNPKLYQRTQELDQQISEITNKYGKFVLFIGRLVYYKGVNVLLDAMRDTEIKVVMIGKGPLQSQVNQYSHRYLLKNQLTVLPPQSFETLKAFLFASAFFVLPSVCASEAFGIVQLEAMICKKAVISTDLPTGVPFVNEHLKTGIVVQPSNSNKLRAALMNLWNNPSLANQMGDAGYERVKTMFTEEQMIQSLTRIFK